MTRRELQKTLWLTRKSHRRFPEDGWADAWKTARQIRKQHLAVIFARDLTEAEQFELEAEIGLASLPVFETAAG